MNLKSVEDRSPTQESALRELQELAPNAPFLALGQTVFWDEPVKAGVLLSSRELGMERRFVAGVHDTDYFAKMPGPKSSLGYRAFPHNDTTTKGFWSAAGEFSLLFGSETVITREALLNAGLKLAKLARARPGILDEATEAWGWRGIASLSQEAKVSMETPLPPLFPTLYETLEWAIDGSVQSVGSPDHAAALESADRFKTMVCNQANGEAPQTLATYYGKLLPEMYAFTAGQEVPLETTATSELLRFNRGTCELPRFEIAKLFVNSETRVRAQAAYNDAIRGTEVYTLDRFGSGAIPFDLVIPGKGRGTIRLGTKAMVVMTPIPQFVAFKNPIDSLPQLASAIEDKFGPNCVLVGKAIALIGSLSREYVFVFHEGASSYVRHSVQFHRNLSQSIKPMEFLPILRIRYCAWEALKDIRTWLVLPEPFRKPFGVEDLCAPSFSARWKKVSDEQRTLLSDLKKMQRPLELLQMLAEKVGGGWERLANEYEQMHDQLDKLNTKVQAIKNKKHGVLLQLRSAIQDRIAAEKKKGEHWREKIFEKQHGKRELTERQALSDAIAATIQVRRELESAWSDLQKEQDNLVRSEEITKLHSTRRNIELEIEFKRLKLIREAVVTSQGLERAALRPSGWWFPLLSPDGSWFKAMVRSAEYYLEPLV